MTTRRRETAKRSGADLERLVELLVSERDVSDIEVFEEFDRWTVAAQWPLLRLAVWAAWSQDRWPTWGEEPPWGAQLFDGFGRRTWEVRWPASDLGSEAEVRKSIRAVGKAATADLGAIAQWQTHEPDAATLVAIHLDLHVGVLRVVREIASTCTTAEECRAANHAAFASRHRLGAG